MGSGRFFCYEMAMNHVVKSSSRLIVAAAAAFEAEAALNVLCSNHVSFTFIEVGIGALKSAQVAARMRDLVLGRPVLFLGSCGASQFSQCELIAAACVSWAPADVRHGESYLIPDKEPPVVLSPLPVPSLRACEISCSSSITSRSEKSVHVYENLELYSTAMSWQPIATAFWGLLGVTNELGPQAHAQWKKYHTEVAELTSLFLNEHLDKFLKANSTCI